MYDQWNIREYPEITRNDTQTVTIVLQKDTERILLLYERPFHFN